MSEAEPPTPTSSPTPSPAPSPTGNTLAKTAKGTAWVFAWRMTARSLGFINTLVLVRLLRPEDFGLIALASSFSNSVEALSYFGIEDALIRDIAPTRRTYDTAFTMSIIRSLAVTLILMALAYPAADFFAEPRLSVVIIALALSVLIEGANNIGTVDFRRNFTFDKEFQINILPRVISTITAITCAFMLRSYWALVISILTYRSLRLVASYVLHPYRPRLDLHDWRKLTFYSFWNWVYGLCGMVAGQIDTFMIGRMMGTASVGYYAVGTEIAALPYTEIIEPLNRSSFSAFSERRREGGTVADVWLRVVSAAALVVFPASVGISLVAPNLVAVFFGAAWTSSTDIVRLLAPLCMVTLLGAISSVVFQAFGQLQLMVGARIGLIVLRVGLLFFLIPHLGLFGVALAMAISTTAENVALTVMALRQMRTSLFGDLVPRLWRCVLAVLAMAMGLSLLGIGWGADFEAALPGMSASFWLFGVSMLGAVIYASTLFGLWLLSGRPKGPEADMLDVGQRVLAQLRSKTRRMRGVG